MPGGAYRLEELGWLQFQALCAAAVEQDTGVGDAAWHGAADARRDVLLPGGLPGRLRGPTLASVVWLRRQIPPERRRSACLGLLDGVRDGFQARARDGTRAASLLLMTNAAELIDADMLSAMVSDLVNPEAVVVAGIAELSRRLDASPELRRRFPAALGTTDLARLLPAAPREASTIDRRAAHQLAPLFVATNPYRRALASLEQHGFVVLTGPPEVGKTAIAQMLALAQLTDGWEAHDCRDPDELLGRYREGTRQIFIADDAFGSTEYRPDSAERWARELDRVLARMDERHWLVWTSRPAPLAAGLRRVHRERGLERFPDPGAVQVDASRLSIEEKVLILFRHAQAAGLDDYRRHIVQTYGEQIVAHRYFTPERIRRLATRIGDQYDPADGPPHARWVDDALRNPTEAMKASLDALEDEHRDLLVALIDAPPSRVSERELARSLRRHHPGGLRRAPHELIDRLADHFLRVTDGNVGWVHPSWRDLVIDQLAGDAGARARFLRVAGLDGVELAVSLGGGAYGDRSLPLMVGDPDWDVLTTRSLELAGELDSGGVTRLIRALTVAVRGAPTTWQRREAGAVARDVLEATVQRLTEAELSLPLAEAWLDTATVVPDAPAAPQLTRAWAHLVPVPPFDSPEEIARADDWLALAELIEEYLPSDMHTLGFPDRYGDVFQALLDAVQTGAPDDPRLVQALGRLSRLVPGIVGIKEHTLVEVEPREPEPLPPEVPPAGAVSVASVLRDLV
jgi:hypothetical protein